MPRPEANLAHTAATCLPARWTPPAGSTSVNSPTMEVISVARRASLAAAPVQKSYAYPLFFPAANIYFVVIFRINLPT